jgi:hypothetical protein
LHTWDQTLKDHFHLHCLIPQELCPSIKVAGLRHGQTFCFPSPL